MNQVSSRLVRLFCRGLLLAVGFQACAPKSSSEPAPYNERPNIILFVSDDHGLDALGCYGNPVIKTPNLDQLAREGIRFTDAFCTSASCSASRSTLLSGQYNHAIGHYGHAHAYNHFSTFDTIRTLPLILNENGYRTARIGKYHLAPEKVYPFDEILVANPRNTVEMDERCKEFLHQQDSKPFFLYFCTDDPHRDFPFTSDPWYKPNGFGNRPEGFPGVQQVQYTPEEVIVPTFLPDTEECRAELAQYYQSVSRIDQGMGRLREILKESDLEKNTIILYISDNGIAFPGAKTTLYDPGMRLPCIIKSPFLQSKGGVSNAMISWVDLAPTILEFAGIPPGAQMQGHSFASVLNQESPENWDQIFASHTFHEITMYYPMRVVMNREFKLIWNIAWEMEYPFASDLWVAPTWQGIYRNNIPTYGKRSVQNYLRRPEFELYHMGNDPEELINLAQNPSYQKVLEALKGQLKQFQIRTRDPWVIKWDHEDLFGGTGVNL